jgi:hypothetical protein
MIATRRLGLYPRKGLSAITMLKKPSSLIPMIALWLLSVMAAKSLADGKTANPGSSECTIAIFSGSVTEDGRPIIWKNRDVSNHDQCYIYYSSCIRNGINTLRFVGNCYRNDTTRIYMGANEAGFAIMNSDSYNLHDSLYQGLDDGTLMRLALETCSTLADFEAFLDSTNLTGRIDCWNFGCLDSTGACAMYECANHSYRKYDPLDPQLKSPGYIARSNFSFSGDSSNQSGRDRYQRAANLIDGRLASGKIETGWVLRTLVRDLANIYADPYPLPYYGMQMNGPPGYIYDLGCTIANRYTSSAIVIRGVRPVEDPRLTTAFVILGPPVLSVAYPLWVDAGLVPDCLAGPGRAPMYEYCLTRSRLLYDNSSYYFYINSHYLVDRDSCGVFSYTLPLEAWGVRQADFLMDGWDYDPPSAEQLRSSEINIADVIYYGFQNETANFLSDSASVNPILPNRLALYNYPNPFNTLTTISYDLSNAGVTGKFPVLLKIFDIGGRLITELHGTGNISGNVYWAGRDASGNAVSSGIYFCSLISGSFKSTSKMILLK